MNRRQTKKNGNKKKTSEQEQIFASIETSTIFFFQESLKIYMLGKASLDT